MAEHARNRAAGRRPRDSQSEARGRPCKRSPAPHRRRSDGRAVQGRCDPRTGVAGANGFRMTIIYRNGAPQDALALDRLFDCVFRETFAHLYRREDLEAFLSRFTIADWEAQLGDQTYAF